MFSKCLKLYVNRKNVVICEKNIKEELNMIQLLLCRDKNGLIAKYKNMMELFH